MEPSPLELHYAVEIWAETSSANAQGARATAQVSASITNVFRTIALCPFLGNGAIPDSFSFYKIFSPCQYLVTIVTI